MNGYLQLRKWRGIILGSWLMVLVFAAGTGAATWTHGVIGGYDIWYLNGTTQKFRYNLTNQQWSHYSTTGSSWHNISATGRANTFIGDGAWYDMGNGWRYQYSAGYDKGTFKDGLKDRLLYKYASGQWYHVGDTTHSWQVLGTGGHNGAFLGDGHWHDLGNGFDYQYSIGYHKGTFEDGYAGFLYKYPVGQWWHSSLLLSGWYELSAQGVLASFVGDGRVHDLANGWAYQYSIGYHKGTFTDGAGILLFKYHKNQWWHGQYSGLYYKPISAEGVSASFVGDGRWHDLGNGWDYQYSPSRQGIFTDGYACFLYGYDEHLWRHRSQNLTEWVYLSYNGTFTGEVGSGPTEFVGNGDVYWVGYHTGGVTPVWRYQYSSTTHQGIWTDLVASFAYNYATCQWLHYTTGWYALSADGFLASPGLLGGDGLIWHSLGDLSGYSQRYRYDWDLNTGYWQWYIGGVWVLKTEYDYVSHNWTLYP